MRHKLYKAMMKPSHVFLLVFCVFFVQIHAKNLLAHEKISIESPSIHIDSNQVLPLWLPLSEIILQNTVVWARNHYIMDYNYAKISLSTWKANLNHSWTWDNNHFAINFFGHPYQGVYYHAAARSSGLNFYKSLVYDMFGSFTWEFFGEREKPSLNDFVITSFAGAMYGEILFRLAERLLAKKSPSYWDHSLAFAMQPYSYIHQQVFGKRPNNPGYVPIEFSIFGGIGSRFESDYRYDKKPAKRLDDNWKDVFGVGGFDLVYGKANRIIKKPLEYFTVSASHEEGKKNRLFQMEVLGKIKNSHKSAKNDFFDIATYSAYDLFYGSLVEMSAFSLGLGTDISVHLISKIHFRVYSISSIVVLGATDFNYDDILKEFYPEYEPTRTYQISYGLNYKTGFSARYKQLEFMHKSNIFLLKTMPGSLPHYGADGWDIVGFNYSDLNFYLHQKFNFGIGLKHYFKVSAYSGEYLEPMSRTMLSTNVHIRYHF